MMNYRTGGGFGGVHPLDAQVGLENLWTQGPVHRPPNPWYTPEGIAESGIPFWSGLGESVMHYKRKENDPLYNPTMLQEAQALAKTGHMVTSPVGSLASLAIKATDPKEQNNWWDYALAPLDLLDLTGLGRGALGIVRGTKNARPQDIPDIQRTEELRDAGMPRDEVVKETGWGWDSEGNLTKEISDVDMDVDTRGFPLEPTGPVGKMKGEDLFGDVVSHPLLKEEFGGALPKTEYKLNIDPNLPVSRQGYYSPSKGLIVMDAIDEANLTKGLGHEVQHLVQKETGLPGGTDPAGAREYADSVLQNKRTAMLEAEAAGAELDELIEMEGDFQDTALELLGEEVPEDWDIFDTKNDDISDLTANMDTLHDVYSNNRGEAVARVTEENLDMPQKQRDETPWWMRVDTDSPETDLWSHGIKKYDDANIWQKHITPHDWEKPPGKDYYEFDYNRLRQGEGAAIHGEGQYTLQGPETHEYYYGNMSDPEHYRYGDAIKARQAREQLEMTPESLTVKGIPFTELTAEKMKEAGFTGSQMDAMEYMEETLKDANKPFTRDNIIEEIRQAKNEVRDQRKSIQYNNTADDITADPDLQAQIKQYSLLEDDMTDLMLSVQEQTTLTGPFTIGGLAPLDIASRNWGPGGEQGFRTANALDTRDLYLLDNILQAAETKDPMYGLQSDDIANRIQDAVDDEVGVIYDKISDLEDVVLEIDIQRPSTPDQLEDFAEDMFHNGLLSREENIPDFETEDDLRDFINQQIGGFQDDRDFLENKLPTLLGKDEAQEIKVGNIPLSAWEGDIDSDMLDAADLSYTEADQIMGVLGEASVQTSGPVTADDIEEAINRRVHSMMLSTDQLERKIQEWTDYLDDYGEDATQQRYKDQQEWYPNSFKIDRMINPRVNVSSPLHQPSTVKEYIEQLQDTVVDIEDQKALTKGLRNKIEVPPETKKAKPRAVEHGLYTSNWAAGQMINQDKLMKEQNPHILDLIAANPPVNQQGVHLLEPKESSTISSNGRSLNQMMASDLSQRDQAALQIMNDFEAQLDDRLQFAKEGGPAVDEASAKDMIQEHIDHATSMVQEELTGAKQELEAAEQSLKNIDPNDMRYGETVQEVIDAQNYYFDMVDQQRAFASLTSDDFDIDLSPVTQSPITREDVINEFGDLSGAEFRRRLNEFFGFQRGTQEHEATMATMDYLNQSGIPGTKTLEQGYRHGYAEGNGERGYIHVLHNPETGVHFMKDGKITDPKRFGRILMQDEAWRKMKEKFGQWDWEEPEHPFVEGAYPFDIPEGFDPPWGKE